MEKQPFQQAFATSLEQAGAEMQVIHTRFVQSCEDDNIDDVVGTFNECRARVGDMITTADNMLQLKKRKLPVSPELEAAPEKKDSS